ncbi:MAG: hypothetical protein RJA70_1057 [Pseudomonadota bacterium]|jgi:tetratricopeptide (TPR) repeat protein
MSDEIAETPSAEASMTDVFAAARLHPADDTRWDAVDEYAIETDSPDPVADLYHQTLSRDLGPETLQFVGQRAVQFLEEWYEDPTRAVAVLRQLIQRDYSNSWALEKLSLLLTLSERWDELLGIYDEALLNLDDSARRTHLLEEAARIAKDFAGQAQRASDYLKQLFLLKPADDKLAASLERRLEQQERHVDLIEAWTARLGAVSTAEELPLRVRIAERYLDYVLDAGLALKTVREILEAGDGEADACSLLERIAAHPASAVEHKREALAVLKFRYSASERLEDVVRVLDLALQIAQQPGATLADQVGLYRELVGCLIHAERTPEAQRRAAAWLVLSPTDTEALLQLRELAAVTHDYALFANSLVEASDVVPNPALRVELLLEAAQTQQTQAGDSQAATELYARVLLDNESTDAAKLLAAQRLTELLTGSSQTGQRLDVLEKLSALEPDEKKQRLVLGEAADLAERLGGDERALRLWDECLRKDAGDHAALDVKVRILSRLANWDALLTTLRARFDHSTDDAQRRSDLVWIAQILDQKLQDWTRAILAWREVEGLFGQNEETVDSLTSLLLRGQHWDDVIAQLTLVEAEEQNGKRRAHHLATLGDTLRDHKAAPADAVVQYSKATAIDPRFQRARDGLRSLLDSPVCCHAAAESLAAAYKAADEWTAWLDLVETRFGVEPELARRQALLLEAAEVVETTTQNQENALAYVQRAFSIAPAKSIEAEMQRLAAETGGWGAAVEGYALALSQCDDNGRIAELLFEQGRLLETRVQNYDDALAAYTRIVELDRAHILGVCAVVRTAGRSANWSRAAWAVLQSAHAHGGVLEPIRDSFFSSAETEAAWDTALECLEAALKQPPRLGAQTSHDLKFLLATWHRDQRSDSRAAKGVLSEAVDEFRQVPSLTMLVELLRDEPSRPLVEALLKLAEVAEDPLPHLEEAAHVSLEVVGDTALGRPILERCLLLAEARIIKKAKATTRETAAWSLDQLVRIATDSSDYGDAFALLTRGATMNFDAPLLRDLKHRAAEVAAYHLGQAQQSIALCAEILEEDPARIATINLLARLYEDEGQLDQLRSLREAELKLSPEPGRQLELRLELARVLGALGEDPDSRIQALRRNLVQLPGHPESVDALAEILAPAERYSELFDVLCEQADQLGDSGDALAAGRLYARAGLLAEQTLEDIPRALQAYRSSVELDADVEVLDALASIHTEREEHTEAVAWLKQRYELTPPAQESARRGTLVRLGNSLKRANREDEAIEFLEHGLSDDPAALEVRQLLARVREERQEWPEFAALLSEGVAFTADPATKVQFLCRSAKVRWHELDDLESAIPLLEKARDLDPTNRELRLTLADALRNAERFDAARDLLDALLTEFGRRRTPERATVHFQLALLARSENNLDEALTQLEAAANIQRSEPQILKALGDVAREKGELERAETAYRALLLLAGRSQQGGIGESAILFELYRIAAERNDQERAKDLLDSALEAADQDPKEALRFEDALGDAKQWELLLGALERRQARADSSGAKREVLRSRASVLVHLERFEEALELRLQLLLGDPHDLELLDQTSVLAEQSGMRQRLTETLLELARVNAGTDPALSCDLWLRLGDEAERRGALAEAANLYERAQATEYRSAQTFDAVRRVHEGSGDMRGLRAALNRFVAAPEPDLDPQTLTDALFRLADLELCAPDTATDGVARLERALDRSPRWEAGIAMLEHSFDVVPASQAALDLLETAARSLGDKTVLLKALVRITAQAETTLAQLQEAVALAQSLDDNRQVEALLRRTVDRARADGELSKVIWAAVRLAEIDHASAHHQAAFDLLSEVAKLADEGEGFELELRIADIAQTGLQDESKAAAVYERLAKREPSDARAWKPLLELYRKNGQYEKLERILGRAEDHVVHADERRALQLERVRLLIDAARFQDAEASLKRALDEEPDHEEASELLIELLANQGRPEEVRDLMYKRMDAAIDRGDQLATVGYALKLGQVCEKEDLDAALLVYRSARAAVPANKEVLSALLRLVPSDEQAERASLMESLLPVEDPEAAENLAMQLMGLRQELRDESGIERAMELGFQANPASEALRSQLEAWYRAREQFAPLAQMISLDAQNREDPASAIERFLEAARLYEEQLGDAAMAAEVLEKANSKAPLTPQVLEALSRYLLLSGQPERALLALTDALQTDGLSGERRGVILHIRAAVRARTDENSLQAISGAIRDLALAKGLGAQATDDDLTALLDRQRQLAEAEGDQTAERGAILQLAQLLPALGQSEASLEMLRRWAERVPSDGEAVSIWGQLATRSANWSAAIAAYKHLFSIAAGSRKLEAATNLAQACENAGVPMDAREVLEQINQEMPGEETVRTRLRRMYEAAGAHKELASLLLAQADNEQDRDARYQLLIDAGDMLVKTGEASAEAVNAFEQALKLKARDHAATVGLSKSYTFSGQIEQACKLLESAIKSHGKKRSPELSQLQHAMALIAQAAGDEEGRFAWLDAALQSDRKNGDVASELAVFAMDRGDFDSAIKALQLITLLKEECPMSRAEAYLRQGIIAQQRGDNKKAALLGKRALTADAGYSPAQEFLDQLGAT